MDRRNFIKGTTAISLIAPLSLPYAGYSVAKEHAVINAGIGGNNTDDLLKRLDADCLQHTPSLTILMIGTNDMNSRKYIPLQQYQTNLVTIVKKIKEVGSKLLLLTIPPAYEPYLFERHPKDFYNPEGYQARKDAVNRGIYEIAKKEMVGYLDIHHIFDKVGEVGLTAQSLIKNELNNGIKDGIHPTPDGYRVMAVAIYEYLIREELPTDKIVCFGDSITYGGGVESKSYPTYLNELLA